jgi:hypothetical protein
VHAHAARPRACNGSRAHLEVAEVFARFGERYLEDHHPSADQRKVMRAIERCRTAALGGHLDVCRTCGYERPAYNSCRNRHCPKCQPLVQHRWLEARKHRILPVHHFHVVFTLPAELRGVARQNRKVVYDLLFRSAADTLLELGKDPKHLGALLGLTAVLHTWTRELAFHPHVHCIVTGGGLSSDGTRWVATKPDFLFPVRVISKFFRGKLLAGLRRLWQHDELELHGRLARLRDRTCFDELVDRLYQTDFVVYAKPPFGGAETVYAYLGRYTHRVGLSNNRLLAIDDHGVSFATKHGRTATLAPVEFIRRFLQHVLPRGFTKLRHYGLLSSHNVETKLQTARRLLGSDDAGHPDVPTDDITWRERLFLLTGIDLRLCPRCQRATMARVPLGHPPPVFGPALMPAVLDTS